MGKRWVLGSLLFGAVLASCGGDDAAPAIIDFTPPANSHLASSVWPIYHGDSWAQHSTSRPAPAGGSTRGELLLDGNPVFVLFDGDGDILTVAKNAGVATLWKIERETLTTVASVPLPAGGTFAGAYGFVDAGGRAILANGNSLLAIPGAPVGDALSIETQLDLTPSLASGESLMGVTAMYDGSLLVLGSHATVGFLDASLAAQPTILRFDGERVYNAPSVDDDGGIYVVTDKKMRRLDKAGGALVETWAYDVEASATTPRPGRLGVGSGTTPVLMMDDHVAIADDAESMNLIVLKRSDGTEVCKVPAFDGASTTDNAIVVAGRTMIIEQNLEGERGVARFDLLADGTCKRAWVADVRAPSCVPTLSTGSGLAYVYTKEAGGLWGLTALDLDDGETSFFTPTDDGVLYDNFWAAVTIGPDATIYVGTLAGLQVFAPGN